MAATPLVHRTSRHHAPQQGNLAEVALLERFLAACPAAKPQVDIEERLVKARASERAPSAGSERGARKAQRLTPFLGGAVHR
jgi:hypothetical protein